MPSLPQALAKMRIVEERISGGMVSSIDPADIANNQLIEAVNVRVRYDKTSRRCGHNAITGSGTINSPVQDIFQFKRDDGSRYTIKIHASGAVQYENGGVWTTATGNTGGGVNDHYQATTIKDRFIISVNGQGKLKELVIGTNTLQDLSTSAPVARYVTSAFNRVVGANIPGISSSQIAWSADGVPNEFDPLVNETAGTGPLMDSPSDLGDPISGILSVENLLFIPRENSLWLATKQPIPSNPFYFQSAVSGIGCNAPFSVTRILKGAAFADTRTGTVWHYGFGGMPEPIGRLVETAIFRNLSDPTKIVGSFDPSNYEYSLMVPTSTPDFVRIWTYNFVTKTWVYDEIANVTTIADFPYAFASATFDDLIGTMDALSGTMSTLGSSSVITNSSRLFGKKDGTMAQEDATTLTDAGTAYTSKVTFKELKIPEDDVYVAEIRFEYQASVIGSIILSYSKDGGNTWIAAKTFATTTGKPLIGRFQKNIKARRFRWKLESSDGSYGLLNYEIYAYPSGLSTK